MGPNSGISGVLATHHFSHHCGRGERSGGLKYCQTSSLFARVFLDMPQEALIHNIVEFPGQTWVSVRG